ncbi:hypothetical protein OROHE_004670 [Orobanche hederae]
MAFSSSLAASSQNDVVIETGSTPRALSKRVNITKGGSGVVPYDSDICV